MTACNSMIKSNGEFVYTYTQNEWSTFDLIAECLLFTCSVRFQVYESGSYANVNKRENENEQYDREKKHIDCTKFSVGKKPVAIRNE